ncbi:MAG: hypothetical protein JXR81_00145 [Candidatus Goldbacteria bacterium]|nr:hypothetical protein [Candidatus Goldiibacteriota bacterium]
MDINPGKNEDEKQPKIRSINEEFEITDGAIIIRSRDIDSKVLAKVMFKEIQGIKIKPAGTLYDGEVVFDITGGKSLKFSIKKYQQEDFEILKTNIRK